MITKIEIQNYRSIYNATVNLSPFTLLIGANGTGKSNFLRLLSHRWGEKHVNHTTEGQKVAFTNHENIEAVTTQGADTWSFLPDKDKNWNDFQKIQCFTINPANIGLPEQLIGSPKVENDGKGAVRVLDSLKTGDREDLFNIIESKLKEYIPEIEKLSFVPDNNAKILQVRERYIKKPIRLSELSDGTRLLLTILTIIYQENPPSVICLEEIDRGLHPRLFEKVIQLCFDITADENAPQIVATTHNPYLVDLFKDRESAVIIVEKKEGQTVFTSLEDRMKNMDIEEEPLGSLWYSGFFEKKMV